MFLDENGVHFMEDNFPKESQNKAYKDQENIAENLIIKNLDLKKFCF